MLEVKSVATCLYARALNPIFALKNKKITKFGYNFALTMRSRLLPTWTPATMSSQNEGLSIAPGRVTMAWNRFLYTCTEEEKKKSNPIPSQQPQTYLASLN